MRVSRQIFDFRTALISPTDPTQPGPGFRNTPRGATFWPARLSLSTQFALAGGVVMLGVAILTGNWMANRIERDVVRNSANSAALFMDSFLSPISQDLRWSDQLSPGAQRALDEIFDNPSLAERITDFKIWKPDGVVIAARDPDLVGTKLPLHDKLIDAFSDEIRAEFLKPAQPSDPGLLEIFSPVHEVWSGDIVAVAEFREVNTQLAQDLNDARRNAWATVLAIGLCIWALLYGIVRRGSRLIEWQYDELSRRVRELREMSQQNEALRLRVQGASERVSHMNDRALQRLGSDLHDGPAQLLALAALRLDYLTESDRPETRKEAEAVGKLIADAMQDIRFLSKGLLLPDLEKRPIEDLIASVVDAHRTRTDTAVSLSCTVDPDIHIPEAIKVCLYRFAQEGLNNAWKHAGGTEQQVVVRLRDMTLYLAVLDRGPGLPENAAEKGLGLKGLRDRIEALGGTFHIRQRPGGGTEVSMELHLREAAI